ncbi:helix-turn-helix domain-containing protein [Tsukamurella pseudospumae]|uniref:HTH cro/C1-type domain-containing protein n=1 Tax=Tsukamurella pseudospumae TaxID=239498 RepID=A0A137ZZN5_9ACTN|nr:helix-turn-helix domain-containing protein [Tsukamurella pseudospumae]KXP03661.1 hypothetical protein AXK60_17825 [Tsukamurella pseudospumae]
MTSHDGGPPRPDPGGVHSRAELGAALRDLRDSAGLTVRELAEQADVYLGTLSGWLSGAHAPTAASRDVFERTLAACGVPESEFDAWWGSVTRARVRSRSKTTTQPGKSPYRGFSAFEIGDSADFFGRDDDAEILFRRITAIAAERNPRSPIMVVGGSGIGKSSVVRAGLAGRFAADADAGWDQVVISPGTAPMEAIDEALAALADRSALRPVLVIDQFEEIWTQGEHSDPGEVLRRVLNLAAGDGPAAEQAPPVVVLALRSDFLDRLVAEPGYAAAAAAGTVIVGPLDRDGLRDAITGPARRAQLAVEPGLVELLLDDADATGDSSGVLPLLSHSLRTTWERSGREGMTVAHYLETGRLAGAVEKSAETVYSGLDDTGRAAMHDLLLSLINVDEHRATRRIVATAELRLDPNAERVLDRLVDARLATVGDDGVQLAHEALVHAWPRLREWVEENLERLRLEHRIRVSAEHWAMAGEPETLLLSSGMLDLIEALSAERPLRWGETERRMIRRSVERRDQRFEDDRKQVRKLRAVALAAGAFALVAVLAAVLAWVGLANTAHARDAAAHAHAESASRQLALESRRLRPRDSALAAQLAVAAYRISETVEARSNLLDTLSDPLASRRLIGDSFEVAASPSGAVVAVRTPNRVDLYRAGGAGLGDVIGRVAITPGALPGSGLVFTSDGAVLLIGTGLGMTEVDVRVPAAPRVSGTTATAQPVVRLSPSGDGRTVLASLEDAPPVLLRRSGDGWRPTAFPGTGFAESQAGVALSADARIAAVSAPGKGIELWDVSGAVPVQRGTHPLDGASNQAIRMAFRGRDLAAGLRSREALVLDTTDPAALALRRTVGGFTSYVNDVEFSADGTRLVAGSSDGQVRVVTVAGDEPDLVFTGPEPVGLATVAGDTVIAAADGGVLRTWPLRTAAVTLGSRSVFQIPTVGEQILVANGGPESAVGQWHTAPGPALVRSGPDIPAPSGDLFSGALAVTADGTTGALGTANGSVYVADLRDRSRPRLSPTGAPALGSIVETVAVTPDGRTALIAGLSTPRVVFVDIADRATPRILGSIEVSGGVPSVGFLSDDRAVLGSARGDLVLVDITDRSAPRAVRTTRVFNASVAALAVAPDGRSLLLAESGGGHLAQVSGISADRDPLIVRFSGPSGSITGASYSPDGTRLVVASSSGEVRLYRSAEGRVPEREASLTVEGAILFDARFTGDGTMVVASGNSGRLRAWDLDPARVIDAVCSSKSAPISTEEWDRLAPGEPYRDPCA